MASAYEQLTAALGSSGIQFYFQSPSQLVVSRQAGVAWPSRGNSFWLTHAIGHWHLFTWSPIGYRIPDNADIVALSLACLEHGSTAMYRVPSPLVAEFSLHELDEVEADAVFTDMQNRCEGE
jgi:hypothetical protein